jgi:hypothetical protein
VSMIWRALSVCPPCHGTECLAACDAVSNISPDLPWGTVRDLSGDEGSLGVGGLPAARAWQILLATSCDAF